MDGEKGKQSSEDKPGRLEREAERLKELAEADAERKGRDHRSKDERALAMELEIEAEYLRRRHGSKGS